MGCVVDILQCSFGRVANVGKQVFLISEGVDPHGSGEIGYYALSLRALHQEGRCGCWVQSAATLERLVDVITVGNESNAGVQRARHWVDLSQVDRLGREVEPGICCKD